MQLYIAEIARKCFMESWSYQHDTTKPKTKLTGLGDGVIARCAIEQFRQAHAGVLLGIVCSTRVRCGAVIGLLRALRLVRDGVVPLPRTARRGGVGTARRRWSWGGGACGHDGAIAQ